NPNNKQNVCISGDAPNCGLWRQMTRSRGAICSTSIDGAHPALLEAVYSAVTASSTVLMTSRIPRVNDICPEGGAPSSTSRIRQQSSIVADRAGSRRTSVNVACLKFGSRPETAPASSRGITLFATGAVFAAGLKILISVEYRPRTTGAHPQHSFLCSPHMNFTL